MKYKFVIIYLIIFIFLVYPQDLDLNKEYSMDEFQKGIRAFHDTQYEVAITHFIKSLSFKDDNHLSRLFLGESYRKAGYEMNAIFAWNTLLSLGYDDRSLKNKIAFLYSKRGVLSDINIDKSYILRDDIKGYKDKNSIPNFLKPSQVFVDDKNHYFIASYLTGQVLELDSNLTIVKNHFPVYPKLGKPFGITVDKEGYLYVSDFANDVVLKFDKLGLMKGKIGFKGIGTGGLLGPEYLLLDDDENLYVVDSGNRRINKYKNNGEILFSIGDKDDDGKLKKPAGMYYNDNKIYVCDRALNKIMVYDKSGNFLFSFGDDKLKSPYSIVKDKFNRFLILCETEIWAYEEENGLWYIIDAMGKRLKKGISLVMDKEGNIIVTDFNTSRLFVLSYSRERYTNLNVNIERVVSKKYPVVNISLSVMRDNFTMPEGLNEKNVSIYENGKIVPIVSSELTSSRDKNADILVLYDKNLNMIKYNSQVRSLLDIWLKNINVNTKVCFVSLKESEAVLENEFNSARLSILESLEDKNGFAYTDKGAGIKFGISHMLPRFSKKAIVLITNSNETGNDFEAFKLENSINYAINNNIPVYIVSFEDGPLSEVYRYFAKKTGGEYYRVYRNKDLNELFKNIENSKGREVIFTYSSQAISRFGDEPIVVTIQVNYQGITGVAKSVYYPDNPGLYR